MLKWSIVYFSDWTLNYKHPNLRKVTQTRPFLVGAKDGGMGFRHERVVLCEIDPRRGENCVTNKISHFIFQEEELKC